MNRETIKGRWKVLSWEQLYDDGRVVAPMGKELEGFIEYSEYGMFCIVSKKDRKHFVTGGQWNSDDTEKAEAYNSYLTYAGGYDVDGETIIHHIKYSLYPNWESVEQYRYASLNNDVLSLTTAPLESDTSESRVSRLVFTRQ